MISAMALLAPPGMLQRQRYSLRFAHSTEDLHQVQRLRFEVFNLELGEGLAASVALGRDEDAHDPHCHHLMVLDEAGVVVGTYRMQTATMASAGVGFYAETEFQLGTLPGEVLEAGVEIGRACVAPAHRTGRVLSMLWLGLARYLSFHHKRYLFGCCSVTAQQRWVGRQLHGELQERGVFHSRYEVLPLPALDCMSDPGEGPLPPLPPLLDGYLKLGARICGPPAIDLLFGTIDFFLLLDLEELTPRAQRFFRAGSWDAAGPDA